MHFFFKIHLHFFIQNKALIFHTLRKALIKFQPLIGNLSTFQDLQTEFREKQKNAVCTYVRVYLRISLNATVATRGTSQ